MSQLSVSIIAHNEEDNIEATLKSVSFADEIIVIVCSSTDRTGEIARKYTKKVFEKDNDPNLNVNKNFGFDRAECEWILCLDADEIIPKKAAEEITAVISGNSSANGYYIPRKNFYFGRWLKHGGNFPDRQLRLFKNGKGRFPEKHVHERIALEGTHGCLLNAMEHHPYKTVNQYLHKFQFYTGFEAAYMADKGMTTGVFRAFSWMVYKPLTRFFRRYFLKGGFLDGIEGFAAAAFDSYGFVVRYLKFREIYNKMEKK